ncbi:carbohydrate ABC transporter permease [Cohnella silvisoli]|uniref:Sugar ABC transporter permease n=1 Tax=Cohnella silvisoli TaxID=2873699 RepID=A0ABV1KT60_9BACL|nr:sugar ABC transporter permease [Cohnella silvisoli]MCD9021541.1 sugar ABC transporter permease [Cohnella silvisoli]
MKTNKSSFLLRNREPLLALAIIGPFLLWYLIINLFPLVTGFLLGFMEWNGLTASPKWVGLNNLKVFFETPSYLSSLWKQLYIGLLCLTVNVAVAFFLALLLNMPLRGRGFFRSAFYIPSITSVATTTAVLLSLLQPQGGGLNGFLETIGMNPIIWTYSPFWMTFWIVVYYTWRSVGPTAIIWLAGLQSIDPTLYEVGKIDGAGRWQLIRYVTIPGLRPIAAYIMITGIIAVMQMWDLVMLISRGGPTGATDVLAYRVYRDGLQSFNLGMAGASSLVLGVLTLLLSFVYLRIFLKGEED